MMALWQLITLLSLLAALWWLYRTQRMLRRLRWIVRSKQAFIVVQANGTLKALQVSDIGKKRKRRGRKDIMKVLESALEAAFRQGYLDKAGRLAFLDYSFGRRR